MKTKLMSKIAKVHEVFVSLQGEGLFAGEKQIFFRFSKCNMACRYCDTNNLIGENQSANQIVLKLESLFWKHDAIKGVTLTGGEPLLYPEIILEITEWAHSVGMPVFLETNGTLPESLKKVLEEIDVVSMDMKLPSSGETSIYWEEHRDFLNQIVSKGKNCYIKIVLSETSEWSEFEKALELVSEADPSLPVFLQPVTPVNGVNPPQERKLNQFKELAMAQLWDVRVQPQWHKYWGVR